MKQIGKKKNREKRREREKHICLDFINKLIYFIYGLIELKFGEEVQNSSSYNLNGGDQFLSSGTGVTTYEQ